MYQDKALQESIKKVEAARAENVKLNPRRMTAEEKDVLLKTFHPDYRDNQFTTLHIDVYKIQLSLISRRDRPQRSGRSHRRISNSIIGGYIHDGIPHRA